MDIKFANEKDISKEAFRQINRDYPDGNLGDEEEAEDIIAYYKRIVIKNIIERYKKNYKKNCT